MKTIIYKKIYHLKSILLLFIIFHLPFGLLKAQKTEITSNLINLEASATDVFRFQLILKNNSDEKKVYDLQAELPNGWQANFQAQGSGVRAVQVPPKEDYPITLELYPSPNSSAGTYPVFVKAFTTNDSVSLSLQAVIKGNYKLLLRSSDERLNTTITSGDSKVIKLILENQGSLDLKDLEFSSQLPSYWESEINPKKLNLHAGKSQEITVKIKTPEKSIAGDYMSKIQVQNPYVNSAIDFRVTLKASILSAWLGILSILIALGLVFWLMKKYGRR